jgi:hypothetical protein
LKSRLCDPPGTPGPERPPPQHDLASERPPAARLP